MSTAMSIAMPTALFTAVFTPAICFNVKNVLIRAAQEGNVVPERHRFEDSYRGATEVGVHWVQPDKEGVFNGGGE